MSNMPLSAGATTNGTGGAPVPLRFEVTVLPVADVDRAKAFYQRLGWRLDADAPIDDHTRVVQFTPPGSAASIIFGDGITTMAPGSVQDLMLIVEDVDAARADLIRRGADVSEVWHDETGVFHHAGTEDRVPGPAPGRGSYGSWASFADPDGNGWLLQEIRQRLPGRVQLDPAALADLLHETSLRHGRFEAVAPPHDWWDWYAAYMDARSGGMEPDEASGAADRYMADVKHVVVPAG
jgi:catechol 2,3-dioxygenase-like lactoylglutathione lyase family enzyme